MLGFLTDLFCFGLMMSILAFARRTKVVVSLFALWLTLLPLRIHVL